MSSVAQPFTPRRVSQFPHLESVTEIATLPPAQLVARYRRGVENFDGRLFKLTETQLDHAFLPDADAGTWPVRILLGHLADAELVLTHRMRRAVGEDNPVLALWDENAFIDHDVYGLRHHDRDPAGADARVRHAVGGNVALIHTVRQWTGQWLATLSDAQWARAAMHPEKGPLTVRTLVAMCARHLEHHARYLSCKLDRLVGPDIEDEASGGGCGPGCGCKPK